MNIDTELETREHYRREAMGAFAHEVRTPLTSIRMVMELARRQGTDGQLLLDAELAAMLASSVDDLQRLADDLQETSRFERGKSSFSRGPCDLAAALAAAELATPALSLEGERPAALSGPWDPERLARAFAGFVEAANRMGDGGGTVRLRHQIQGECVCVSFSSGAPGGAAKVVSADAGYGFFRSRQFVLTMSGSVDCERSERFVKITVMLPLADGGAS